MTQENLRILIDDIMQKVQGMRAAGQKEYARKESNAFANFERIANSLNNSREEVLMVYLLKHIDGIISWVEGHKSQRESVKGRIIDAITYLCLLYGMSIEDTDTSKQAPTYQCIGDEVI